MVFFNVSYSQGFISLHLKAYVTQLINELKWFLRPTIEISLNCPLGNLIVLISVPDIPDGNGEGQSALPTPNENGIYLFDDLNTFELVCNSSACDWMIKSTKRSIVRQNSPITMYLLPKMAEDLCTDCGKNNIT